MNEAVDTMKRDVAMLKQQQATEEPAQEEAKQDPQVEPEQQKEDQPQLSERDQMDMDQALKSGWKPPDEFEGNEEDFIKPREWNRHVRVLKKLDAERAERNRLAREVETFKDRVQNVMEVTRAKTIAELEAKKQEAVEDSDYGKVQAIDDEIKKTEQAYEVVEEAPAQQPLRPEVDDWMAKNPWFKENKNEGTQQEQEMTKYAVSIQLGQLMNLRDPSNPTSAELEQTLNRTERIVKNEYPDYFQRKPRATAQTLEKPTSSSRSKKKFGYNDLNNQEKKVLEQLKRFGGMSEEDYIQACADMRDK